MSAVNKDDAIETVRLIEDGCCNLDRQPHVEIDELLWAIKYLSAKSGVWSTAEDLNNCRSYTCSENGTL